MLLHLIRCAAVCLSVASLGTTGFAAPPGALPPGGGPQPFYLPPPIATPTFVPPAVGYSSPLYSPYRGLDYSPFAYRHLNPAVTNYNVPRSYTQPYPGSFGSYSVPPMAIPYRSLPPLREMIPPQPLPLPLPAPVANLNKGETGTITVIANEGATVTFAGAEVKGSGGRHSFTTKPIPPGTEMRVQVKVDGTGGASTISIGVRAGERATVDMRK